MIWQVIFLRCGCASHVRCIASGSIFAKPNCRAWCQHGTIVTTLLTRSETFVTIFDLYCCVLLVWEAAPSPNGCRDVGSEIVKRIRFSHLVTHAVTWQRHCCATCDFFLALGIMGFAEATQDHFGNIARKSCFNARFTLCRACSWFSEVLEIFCARRYTYSQICTSGLVAQLCDCAFANMKVAICSFLCVVLGGSALNLKRVKTTMVSHDKTLSGWCIGVSSLAPGSLVI